MLSKKKWLQFDDFGIARFVLIWKCIDVQELVEVSGTLLEQVIDRRVASSVERPK